jgi:glycerol-3-phosphate dehydrogenase (NAD(P)+)
VASVRVAILGAGNLGTALGIVLTGGSPGIRAGRNRHVSLWTIEADVAEEIRSRRQNRKYLPDVELPRGLHVTLDLRESLAGAEVVIFALPSKVVREVARQVGAAYAGATPVPKPALVSASKGLEAETDRRMSQVIAGEMPEALGIPVLAMSGPSIAHELSRGVPTAVTLAHTDPRCARAVRRQIQTPILRFDISRDVAGVELGGVLKNAYTLLFGLCDGLGLGLNTKAALLTRALPEMTRLGVALGGRRATFMGLAGLGDLVGTGLSHHSRNRRMGEELVRRSHEDALAAVPGVVEGVGSLALARALAAKRRLKLPILEGLAAILDRKADALTTIQKLAG